MQRPEAQGGSGGWRAGASVAALAAVVFATAARFRMVDDDEGFYALAGRAILDGELPYRDFFFPQTPISAVAYAGWQAVFGPGLQGLRGLAALASVATAVVVHVAAARLAGRVAGLLAAALFVTHSLVWEWSSTVKTFPLGLLFSTAALAVAVGPVASRRRAVVAGLLAGLAVSTRLLALPVVPCVLGALSVAPGTARERSGRVLAGLLGFALGALPMAAFCLVDPGAFWFDNVRYHALPGPGTGFIEDPAQKLRTLGTVLLSPLGATRPDATGIQTTALVALAGVGSWRARRDEPGLVAFFGAAVLLGLAALLPSPSFAQHFTALVPPASVVAGACLARVKRPPWVMAAVAAAYAAAGVPAFGDRILGADDFLRPAAVDAVGAALDRATRPGDVVAAHWPAYLGASHRPVHPAARNQFSRLYSERVPAPSRRRYRLYTEAEFRDALLRGEARAFVVGAFTVPETALALRDRGLVRAAELPGATVWVYP